MESISARAVRRVADCKRGGGGEWRCKRRGYAPGAVDIPCDGGSIVAAHHGEVVPGVGSGPVACRRRDAARAHFYEREAVTANGEDHAARVAWRVAAKHALRRGAYGGCVHPGSDGEVACGADERGGQHYPVSVAVEYVGASHCAVGRPDCARLGACAQEARVVDYHALRVGGDLGVERHGEHGLGQQLAYLEVCVVGCGEVLRRGVCIHHGKVNLAHLLEPACVVVGDILGRERALVEAHFAKLACEARACAAAAYEQGGVAAHAAKRELRGLLERPVEVDRVVARAHHAERGLVPLAVRKRKRGGG